MKDLSTEEKKKIEKDLDELITLNLNEAERLSRLKKIIAPFIETKFTPLLLGKSFLLINPPDSDGFTKEITIDELSEYHTNFKTSNGGDWCRSNNSYLGKHYVIKRNKIGGRIGSVKLEGTNKGKTIKQTIRKDIADEIRKKRCAILDVGNNIEVDHKNGKKDEHYMNDTINQGLGDFQPLSKAANDAKREHCKKCKETGRRYDAKQLGYSESFTKGDFDTDNCQGCYWFDPQKFNQEISANFKKEY